MPQTILGRISAQAQRELLADIQGLLQAAPPYHARMPGTDAPFRYRQSGAGWGWTSGHGGGYRYQQTHPVRGTQLPPIPPRLITLARRFGLEADALLINLYEGESASLGLHQDKDEADLAAPVISISLGASAEFLLGGQRRSDPTQTLLLSSGTVMQLAGDQRLAFHGVKRILPGTGPQGLLHPSARINLTLRRSQ